MSEKLDDLKKELRKMFQLDQADLDFGIYRIMNQKRDEIEQFLDRDLLPQVKTAFASFEGDDLKSVREELEKLKKTLDDAGVVAETSPKYQALQAKLSQSVDVSALENETFSQLTNFFRRYYQGGDFMSLRRYKAGVYAIPYEGEEVKLHWANADQYYIKSSENFRDYSFKLPSGKRAHFKLVDASTEQNNKKEQAGKERRFILVDDTPLVADNGELFIRFEYKIDEDGAKQTALNEAAVQAILAAADDDWKRELFALAPTEKNPRRTLLEKHLNDYTAKYSFDYFIHKDLGGFMRRELDFFIKNEVLFIDDLDADHVRASISKIKVIKEIANKVIAFLEQLENFQKKLWLKKKFVVETGYCVTLDKVPVELYPAIISNKAQVEEWKALFGIQNIEGDLHTPKNTDPVSIEFLKSNPFLVLDTVFFGHEFTERLLMSFDNFDDVSDGILVHGENFHALNLIMERFRGQVKCSYVDPPYNTGKDGFLYKDNYQHSSWISFMENRFNLINQFLKEDGAIYCSIDDSEANNLECLATNYIGLSLPVCFFIQVRYPNKTLSEDSDFHKTIEKVYLFSKNDTAFKPLKELVNYSIDKFEWQITESGEGVELFLGNKKVLLFTQDKYNITKVIPSTTGLKETWATGSLARQKGSSGEYLDLYLAPRKEIDGLSCLYKVYGIGEDGLGFRYFTGPKKEDATKGKFYSGIPLDTLKKIDEGGATKELPIPNFYDFAAEFGNCRQEGGVDISGGKKPEKFVAKIIGFSALKDSKDFVLDPFAGSGTTPSVAFKTGLKFIGVEVSDYFDTKILTRMKKVYCGNDAGTESKPRSGLFKYIRLESYEDALNNLQLKRTQEQGSLLDQHDELREQYMLSYMLDVESAGSSSLLNIDAFTNPFNYRMNIARGNETKETVVDLVETFNWLLGIKVLRISQKEYRNAEFETDAEGRLQIKGRPRTCSKDEGWTFQEVEGQTLASDKVLIIWRTLTDNPEQDNLMLEAWFSKRNYSTLDFEFSRIYVNGDNNLENLKIGEERWKVALIEHEFKKLMFDVEGI